MKKSFQIGAAFIGLIVGAGFASGQEILQFFTSFGYAGIAGSLVATALFAFIGMNLTQLGSRLQSASHKDVIYHICGRYLGVVVDFIITFFLFGVTVVMLSGAGAIFEQQFGIPSIIGSIVVTALAILTITLNVKRVIALISAVTPFLLVLVIIIMVYSLMNFDASSAEIAAAVEQQKPAAANWILGALLYVSYNIAAGASMLTVMGGTVKDQKVAGWGGIIGGIGLGLLILLINISMLTRLSEISEVPMPMLFLANQMSPIIGIIMTIVLLGMIYNTAVGMLYAFTARLIQPDTPKFKGFAVLFGVVAFGVSFIGFITLVGTVYPTMGYLGFTLIGAIVLAWFMKKRRVADNR
ncbi:hypothetical protein OXB_1609 [Bacillus sp. OxB-1]|uniref:YkvI family membrane protein n=1 Tax=Bacillus sp. (strain OxB-1) TaxID=98228 RepID=UPI00058206DD|nr:membrane protein [Bacillus sp. OxB-1]BAQ10080.1 hypothetical protein OXB_1609 [Bacillus sp. OxB-1]